MALPPVNPRNKLIALGAFTVILFFLSWQLCFKKTIRLFFQIKNNQSQLDYLAGNAFSESKDRQYAHEAVQNPTYSRESLFEIINNYCRNNSLQISRFHPEQRYSLQNFNLISNILEIQGEFKDILGLCWLIEYKSSLGYIVSSEYKLLNDRKTKKDYLIARITIHHYIQNYENPSN